MSKRTARAPKNHRDPHPRVRRDGYDGAFVARQQFSVDMRIRRQAERLLAETVPAARWPLVLDAIEAAAWPVEDYLATYVRAGHEVKQYRQGHPAGDMLHQFAARTGWSIDDLVQRPHERMGFWFGDKPDTAEPGDLPFGSLRLLYHGYFVFRAATVGRHAFFATPEMSALVDAGAGAAESGQDVAVTAADLPSPRGVVYLAPLDGDPDHARVLAWNISGTDASSGHDVLDLSMITVPALRIWLGTCDGSLTGPVALERFVNDYMPRLPLSQVELSPVGSDEPPMSPVRSGGLLYSDARPDEPWESFAVLHDPDLIARTFFSLVNMLRGNKFVDSTSTPAARMRRNDGTVVRMHDVTYLSYRQPRGASSAAPEGTGRLSKRHVVRGHWRRHWYPSQNRHLPLWIDEHLQGPPDAPIEVKTKVAVLRPPPNEPTP